MRLQKIDKKIGLAVSGGKDSMAMLYCYHSVGQDMLVINIEHGIRGESSLSDSAFVKQYCKRNNIEFLGFSIDAISQAKEQGESIETAARNLRYQIFERLLIEKKVELIALAHHADDNAETVLMRIFRGTGIKGLRGIIDRENYIHPMLKYTRAEIENYVSENNIPYVNDETNEESEYTRNFIRLQLMPIIKSRYPEVVSSIARLSENAQETEEYLLSCVNNAISATEEQCVIKGFFDMERLLAKCAAREGFYRLKIMQDIEARHIESILELKNKPNNTSIDMPYKVRAIRHGQNLIIAKNIEEEKYSQVFDINIEYAYKNQIFRFVRGKKLVKGISFDLDKVPFGAVVRKWSSGDIFKSVNGRTKLLSDYLNGKKMSLLEKENVLVLAKEETILAVMGYDTSDLIKIEQNTKNIILIIKEQNTYDERRYIQNTDR